MHCRLCNKVHAVQVPWVGPALQRFMMAFIDGRDGGLLLVSHFSLLLGMAAPVWLSSSFLPPQRLCLPACWTASWGQPCPGSRAGGARAWGARAVPRCAELAVLGGCGGPGLPDPGLCVCGHRDPGGWGLGGVGPGQALRQAQDLWDLQDGGGNAGGHGCLPGSLGGGWACLQLYTGLWAHTPELLGFREVGGKRTDRHILGALWQGV